MNKPLTIIYNPYINKNNSQISLFDKKKINLISSDQLNLLVNHKNLYVNKLSKKILFLEKNIALASYLEKQGYYLYNSKKSIEICDNKALTHIELSSINIEQPKTLIGPLTFNLKKIDKNNDFIKNIKKNFKYPVILKEVYGSFGHQVYLMKSENELIKKLQTINGSQVIVQEFFKKYAGQSIRVIFINKKIVGCIKQINQTDYRSNLTLGSHSQIIKISNELKNISNKIIHKLNLFYGGIDFICKNNGTWIFCEINSNAQLNNISKIFNKNFGEVLIKKIIGDKKYYEK